ncbi:hypothetical protein MUO14_03580 [Halobacillus shinanisalinarum]|uniref:Uncharacterized protein n=2 Tax=Halobacillus TaxID=45667 RepID=A0ABY4HAX8_9BACI|nr:MULTISPECIES: hypothetical protein [Halobacillus]UOQ94063.1 hypothetical protein MUO14_03580 [Halobacillus shinanisalinarum]UOR12006.1 hypothetical protein MUO15_00215 [Halobacillus amylolyticus]
MAKQKQKQSPLKLVKETFGDVPAKKAFQHALAPYFDKKEEYQTSTK